jgi:hypothetical protein
MLARAARHEPRGRFFDPHTAPRLDIGALAPWALRRRAKHYRQLPAVAGLFFRAHASHPCLVFFVVIVVIPAFVSRFGHVIRHVQMCRSLRVILVPQVSLLNAARMLATRTNIIFSGMLSPTIKACNHRIRLAPPPR